MKVSDDGFDGWASGRAVDNLSDLAQLRLREREKTKRLLIVAVVLLVMVASAAMLWAPEGREQAGYVLGGVLFVLALGAIGASRFLLRAPGIQVAAGGATPSEHSGPTTGGYESDITGAGVDVSESPRA